MMESVVVVKNGTKRARTLTLRLFALAVVLCTVVLLFGGCSWQHPGETVAETNRRHQRGLRLNNQTMLSDLDRVLMLDKPSGLTDLRIP
jgi:hypothetical protein